MKNLTKKIVLCLPAIVTSVSIVCAVFFIYYGTLSMNHSIKEAGIALPMPTILAIALSKYHVLTIIAFFCVCIVGLIEWKIKERQKKLVVEIYMISMFMILTALTFAAMGLPFACLCDAWKQW